HSGDCEKFTTGRFLSHNVCLLRMHHALRVVSALSMIFPQSSRRVQRRRTLYPRKEGHMSRFLTIVTMFIAVASLSAADLDPKAINIQLPKDIKWVANTAAGSETAVLLGDPNKPGLYIILQKWLPHHNSRPHYHATDRYVTVLSGTWWVQTGPKYDPAGFKPV